VSGTPEKAYGRFRKWLGKPSVSTQLAAAALSVAYGSEDGNAFVHDQIAGDWPTINTLIARVSALNGAAAAAYGNLLEKLNGNALTVTPSKLEDCGTF
jgi:hypothetical protein